MLRRPPRSTRTDTLFPYTTLFRSCHQFRPADHALGGAVDLSGHPVRCDVLDPVQRDGAVTMAAASTSQEREVVIRVRGLVNRYDENIVHENLDLDVWRGEVLGVVGGSGTGKSVLLRSIIGLNRIAARRKIGKATGRERV